MPAIPPSAGTAALRRELGRARAIILTVLVTVCAALVPSLTPLASSLLPTATAPAAAPVIPEAQPEAPAPTRAKLAAVPDPRREIEALATFVARKYRISAAATREMVTTAYREGRRAGLDPLLILAVIAVESRFNPIAESDFGAQGLMQVVPAFHKDKFESAQVDSVLDPHANIRLGVRILREYIRRGGTEVAGLQLYNGTADDASTAYATKVLAEKQRLQQAVKRVADTPRA
jgi:soluble lytic murein transglycosylase-like protein